jgi:hypothetical protein
MAAISNGVTCLYGVAGAVTELFVQSYSIASSFNADATVMDEDGLTVTHRMDDRKSEISIEGIAKSDSIPELGDTIDFTAQTTSAYGTAGSTSFSGTVTKVDEKGSNKAFVSVSITAISYEGVADPAP